MTPVKRFEALRSTYMYATKQQLPTTVSIEPRHSYSIVLRYIQWNHDTTMGQGTDKMRLLLQGYCISNCFYIFYFFWGKEYSSFCLGLLIWGSLYIKVTSQFVFVLHHFYMCLSCSYTTCKLCCLSFIQMWFCLRDKSPSHHPQCTHTYYKWTGELPQKHNQYAAKCQMVSML